MGIKISEFNTDFDFDGNINKELMRKRCQQKSDGGQLYCVQKLLAFNFFGGLTLLQCNCLDRFKITASYYDAHFEGLTNFFVGCLLQHFLLSFLQPNYNLTRHFYEVTSRTENLLAYAF
jgi:hypothetical protein